MKILIVLYYYHPYVSGLSLLAKMQAEGLATRGHEVTVLALQHQAGLAETETLNGVNVVRAKVLAKASKGGLSWEFLRKIVDLSKTHDIINPHLPMAHFGLVLPFLDKKKLVPQYHCDLNLGSGLLQSVVQKISYWSMGWTLAASQRIIATTADYFNHCHFGRYAPRVCEIYPPVLQSRFAVGDASGLKRALDIEGEPYLVGFVGRIVAEKGLDYLLQAIPYLEERNGDFLILIAGDYQNIAGGSVIEQINRLIKRYPHRVKLIGHLKFDDLVRFYNLIDVLILPSVDPLEAFGMVQLEAMLCGTPVIASDMPGVRELIRQTGFGRLVRMRDPRDIADKLSELRDNPPSLDTDALAEFDAQKSLDRYERLFAGILNSHGP